MTYTPTPFSPFTYARAIRGSALPAVSRHVALTLVTYADRTGEAWPSQATLSTGTGWSRRTVNTALDTLELGGWLTRVTKGYRGRATLYRLHIPGPAAVPGLGAASAAAPRPTAAPSPPDHGLCTTGDETVQEEAESHAVSCAPTPPGERSTETPSGRSLAAVEGIPGWLWEAAHPVVLELLDALPAETAARFVTSWPTLAKRRDFCWHVTALVGTNPQARPPRTAWSATALVEAMTVVTLDGVAMPASALYRRLINLVDDVPAVPSPDEARPRRKFYALPPGLLQDAADHMRNATRAAMAGH